MKTLRIGSNISASIAISTPQTEQYLEVSEREVTIMSCGTCACYIKVTEAVVDTVKNRRLQIRITSLKLYFVVHRLFVNRTIDIIKAAFP